jgi:membrane-bound serine protease (ClpP class)
MRPTDWIEGTVSEAKSHTANEALAAGAIDLLADGRRELLAAIDGREVVIHGQTRTLNTRDATIEVLDMRLGQRILHALAHPTIAYLLLMLGMLLVYVELSQPGGYIAGGIGAVAIVLAIISLQILPFDAGGLVLTLLGIGLLIAEHFLPTLGILGVAGLVALVIGGLMLFDTDELTVRTPPWLVVSTASIFAIAAVAAGWLVTRAHREGPSMGAESMVGGRGEVMAALAPSGQVRVRGELWSAQLEGGGQLEAGRLVEVTRVDGLRLTVRPADGDRRPLGRAAVLDGDGVVVDRAGGQKR